MFGSGCVVCLLRLRSWLFVSVLLWFDSFDAVWVDFELMLLMLGMWDVGDLFFVWVKLVWIALECFCLWGNRLVLGV